MGHFPVHGPPGAYADVKMTKYFKKLVKAGAREQRTNTQHDVRGAGSSLENEIFCVMKPMENTLTELKNMPYSYAHVLYLSQFHFIRFSWNI